MDVDIQTGRPLEEVMNEREAQKAREEGMLEGLVSNGILVEQKLKGPDGEFFMDLVVKLLEARVDQLVLDDPQSQSILKILRGLGNQIHIGRASAERLAFSRLRMAPPNDVL